MYQISNKAEMDKKDMDISVRIFQITDMHLLGDVNKKFLGIKPSEHLQAIVDNAKQQRIENAENLLLLTGDISQDFSPASYQLALNITSQLNLPTKTIAGNHDDKTILTQIMLKDSYSAQKSISFGAWHIILLNSHWPKHVAGQLTQEELEFLQAELNDNRQKNILIFVHHHVLPVGAPWVDSSILMNAEQFLAVVAKYQNIKAVFSGHVHQDSVTQYQNISFYTTPAVAWQFLPKQQTFQLDTQMPGYRIIDLYKNGKYTTKVIRLAYDETFVPDLNSKGY